MILALAAVAAPLPGGGAGAQAAEQPVEQPVADPCPVAEDVRPSALPAGLRRETAPGAANPGPAEVTPSGEVVFPPRSDYRHRLGTTAAGWPRLDRWCVWVEPASGEPGASRWDDRWLEAVGRALGHWREQLPIRFTEDPGAAHIRVRRRRPPLRSGPDGRSRASHGRAMLALVEVSRGGTWRLEPHVEVLISPGQRELAIEATALHELGHAFGLWGHSDDAGDAMAVAPGADPVVTLSDRDRATLRWLYRQPTGFGRPFRPDPAIPAYDQPEE